MTKWVQQQGGEMAGQKLERANSLFASLHSKHSTSKVYVLATSEPCAWSWPSGEVFLSAGLMDCMTDDEIRAAIAHEMGHLIGNGHVDSTRSLRGAAHRCGLEEEKHADALGVELLITKGIPPESMSSMLTKLANDRSTGEIGRKTLLHRAEALQSLRH